jgi:hypothetical protein
LGTEVLPQITAVSAPDEKMKCDGELQFSVNFCLGDLR